MFDLIKERYNQVLTKGAVTSEHGEYLKGLRLKKLMVKLSQLSIMLVAIFAWELAAKYRIIDPFITSYPTQILKTIYKMALNGELVKHTWTTVYETLVGFSLGAALGLLIASILWWSDYLSKVFEPFIVLLNALPKMALGPILIIWLGNGVTAIIGMALLISVIITVMMVYNGFKEADQNKIKLLKTLGATKFQIFKKVVVMDNLATIFSALKVNIGLSLVGTIVGEFLVSKAGLGYLIVYGGQVFKLNLVMTSIIILSIVAGLLYYLILWLEKRVIKWES